ncbi:MAG: DUF167 domain-containing protein [Thermodesulfovibrionales bacterium]
MEIPHKKTKDGIVIGVKVQPRSSRRGIEIKGEEIKVRLTSPPVDNKANEELIEFLSEELGVKKNSISIIKGLSSRQKVLLIKKSS